MRIEQDNPEKTDDWQTEQDQVDKAEFNLMKEKKRQAQILAQKEANAKRGNDDVGIFINLDD